MSDLILVTADDDGFDNLHRMEQSAAIEPGTYWRCLIKVEGIDAKWEDHKFYFGESRVYLLTRLEYFDGKLHSVVLLNDPMHGNSSGLVTLPIFHEHFEWISDAAAKTFREAQIAQIMSDSQDVQKEMADAQTDPTILGPVIAEGLAEWEREQASRSDDNTKTKTPGANLPALAISGRFDLTAAVSHRIGSSDVATFRHMAQREGVIAEIRGKWLTDKVREMTRIMEKLPPFYAETAALGMARAHESLTLAKDVQKGLRSLRLYTGDGVIIDAIKTGASAPANVPLTVYQRKLIVAEEFAVWTDVDRMFDYTQNSVFLEALSENASLREQLIPAQRGVLAMAMRRTDVNYDPKTIAEALEARAKNEANRALFLLVRDGENWYQVFSDEPSHELSPRLFPTRSEMGDIFQGLDGETIGFEDLRFTNKANEFDRKSLSYKRFLILACGLDHRKQLFGTFYPADQALNFISQSFQRKYMHFVSDDDGDVMLSDSVGSVADLIRDNHSQLAAGSRILVFSKNLLQQQAAPGAFDKGWYDRNRHKTEYSVQVKPQQKCVMLTVRRDKGDLVVDLPVQRTSTHAAYSSNRLTKTHFNVRVALNKLDGDDLCFLITETLTSDQLRPFIYSRRARASDLEYIYGFKLAMVELARTEAGNAATLDALRAIATDGYGLTANEAQVAAISAVQTWRQENPDEGALPQLRDGATPGLAADLVEALTDVVLALKKTIPKIDRAIAEIGGRLIRVMRGKRGSLIAYYEQPDAERDLRIHNWRWVGRRVYSAAGKEVVDSMQTVMLSRGRILGETELMARPSTFVTEFAARTDLRKSLHDKLDNVTRMAEVLVGAFTGPHKGISDHAWLVLTDGKSARENIKYDDDVGLPLAVNTDNGVVIGVQASLRFLLHWYGSDAQRAMLAQWHADEAKSEADEIKVPRLRLISAGISRTADDQMVVHRVHSSGGHQNIERCVDDRYFSPNESISRFLASVPKDVKRNSFGTEYLDPKTTWFAPACTGPDGTLDVDRFFPDYPETVVAE